MKEKDHALYEAFISKDPRFDGRFFVGISSTGIYCRPICKARRPKEENCSFYSTAAEAENAGYRPCLLCRPEMTPGNSIIDSSSKLAHSAARYIEENCGNIDSINEIAEYLGCTDRHLRRIFTEEFNVSPVQYLQTCRLLLAKNLLTETNLTIVDIAMASGFGSLRRFNDLFKNHYRLSPTALRKQLPEDGENSKEIRVSLGYRPPYLWDEMLNFLAYRAIPGVEYIIDNKYMRTISMVKMNGEYVYGWIKVGHNEKKNALIVELSESLIPVLTQVISRVKSLFDLNCDPYIIYENLMSMKEINPELPVLGTRLPGCFNPFEMSVRAVLGQQITVKAASTIAGRLVNAYGKPIETGIEGLTHVFPLPEDIVLLDSPIENQLGPLGIIKTRSRTIYSLAEAFVENTIDFSHSANIEEEIVKLLEIPGIGNWTAQYIAMRTMEWTDAFLETDVGVKNAMPTSTPKERLQIAEKWRPWRSYANINLWNSL